MTQLTTFVFGKNKNDTLSRDLVFLAGILRSAIWNRKPEGKILIDILRRRKMTDMRLSHMWWKQKQSCNVIH